MDSSVEMKIFGQYYGESLVDASFRIKNMSENGVNKHTPAALIRNFYNGLDGWSKCFLDSLTNGRFASGNPSHANNLMENLFGKSIETKEEIGIKLLKFSLERATSALQTYVEEYPTKNVMHSFILHSKTRMKKTSDTLSEISGKIEKVLTHAKSKKELTREVNDKISSMLELLERNLEESVKEENDLEIILDALFRKRNERKVEEVKMLNEVKEPLLDLDN